MITPYDWYESLSQRSQYIENRLRTGSPVVGLSIVEGALLYTYRKQVRKVYEVYDRLMFSALGQQADVESLRVTAVEFAHQEGFLRSEQDVTIQRVVGFALSAPLRRAYGDITVAPFVVNALFAEINEKPEEDLFFTLRYDGEFDSRRSFAVVAGTPDAERRAMEVLEEAYSSGLSLNEAQALAERAWRVAADVEGVGEPLRDLIAGTQPEVGFLARESRGERRFRLLTG